MTGTGTINRNGHNITFVGPYEALPRKVFTGTGEVRFLGSLSGVYPQWFGSKGDGTTNDTPAIDEAIKASGGTGNVIALDGAVGNVSFVSRSGRAILKPLASNDILSGAYHGWKFENIEFQGACVLGGTRKPEFTRCAFRVTGNYGLQLTGVISPKFIDSEFYGTRAGVMQAGVTLANTGGVTFGADGATFGSGKRLSLAHNSLFSMGVILILNSS